MKYNESLSYGSIFIRGWQIHEWIGRYDETISLYLFITQGKWTNSEEMYSIGRFKIKFLNV